MNNFAINGENPQIASTSDKSGDAPAHNFSDDKVAEFNQALKDNKVSTDKTEKSEKPEKSGKSEKNEEKTEKKKDDSGRLQKQFAATFVQLDASSQAPIQDLTQNTQLTTVAAKGEVLDSLNMTESRMLESIAKVAELVKVEAGRIAANNLAGKSEITIQVRDNILPKTEIKLTDLGSKFQVQLNMNDVRAVQVANAYKEDLQKQLGDNYQLAFKDMTLFDGEQNPNHESATKQEMFDQDQEQDEQA